MGPPPPVDPRILRTHAGNLELLGYRIELVGHVSAEAALCEDVFGDLCAPVAALIEDRRRDQDELTGRFPVNLENATRKLHRMADGKRNGNRERRADYWASTGRGRSRKAPEAGTGSRPSGGGDFDALVAKFRERTWLDDRLAARGAAPASTAPVRSGDDVNPAAPLADPLRSLIDRMDVDREAAAAAARRWALIAAELREIAEDLEWSIEADLKGWQGPDHLAYQHLMARNVNGIAAVAASAAVLGHAVEGAASAVQSAREAVSGLVDRLAAVGREAVPWSAQRILGLVRAAFGIWALVLEYLRALARSMAHLRTMLGVRRSGARLASEP
ncbi:hypothetical protein [Glycomyces tritici]|uniref:Uncharacterized protein n=1 Tax=Glycomyces tritici TaxID=2665176 RepID=A0ABT7YYB5_9ACTN|nr:hypothetical protein [Glycomyces tritici]MDN3243640.1 hypothetical protein [Glycomyces tritici]